MIKRHLLTGFFSVAFLLFMAACGGQKTDATAEETVEETANEPEEEAAAPIESPRQQAEGEIDGVSVAVDYGSPAVKGRKVWGGLEPYGKVWRAGANETTSVEFKSDVNLGETKVPAGKYGLYIIPNEAEAWVVILNTDWNREEHGAWGAYNYNVDNDVARVMVTPEASEENQERLAYAIAADGIQFSWEKVRFTIPVTAVAVGN